MRQLVLAIAAVVAVLFVATPASAVTTGFTTATVHMRSGPSVHHSIVTVIPRGRQVTVLECLRAPRWCQVVWRGYRGWVYSRYLSTTYLPGYSTYPPSVYLEFDILPGLRYHGPRRPRYHSPRPVQKVAQAAA